MAIMRRVPHAFRVVRSYDRIGRWQCRACHGTYVAGTVVCICGCRFLEPAPEGVRIPPTSDERIARRIRTLRVLLDATVGSLETMCARVRRTRRKIALLEAALARGEPARRAAAAKATATRKARQQHRGIVLREREGN